VEEARERAWQSNAVHCGAAEAASAVGAGSERWRPAVPATGACTLERVRRQRGRAAAAAAASAHAVSGIGGARLAWSRKGEGHNGRAQ
jgi:hypothetical protein